jgi:hypothetical protein
VIDVSGHSGGGTALIGGDYQGGNPLVQNAQRTFVGQGSSIIADAITRGNGGRVIVWADDVTRFAGSISARGGEGGGDGGFAEVSGKNSLEYRGRTDLRAPLGEVGRLLLDPKFIIIDNAGTDPADSASNEFADNAAGTSTIDPADLVTALNLADVTLQANTDITFANDVNASANANIFSLILQAGRSIVFNNNVNVTVRGSFAATFNDGAADTANRDPGAAEFMMGDGSSVTAPGGISIQGGTLAADSGGATSVSANTGDIQIEDLFAAGVAGGASSAGNNGGNITILNNAAAGKNIAIAAGGTVDTGGANATGPGDFNGGNGGTITINASGTLSVRGINSVGGNGVGAGADGTGGNVSLTSGGDLTVVEVGGSVDVDAGSGVVNITAGASGASSVLHLDGDIIGTGGISLTADQMTIDTTDASLEAGTGTILFRPFNAGTLIDIGGADAVGTPNTLGLTAGELAQITGAGAITIGNATAGNLDVTADVNLGALDLNLISGGNIAFENGDTLTTTGDAVLTAGGAINNAGGGANIAAATLSATAQTGIDLETTIATLTLADVLGTGAINISDTAGGLAVTTATTANGDITLNATGGDLTVATVTASGTGADVQLTTTTSGDVTVGAVTAAGDIVTINSAGAIIDGNAGAVNIVADSLSATAGAGIDLDTDIATLTLATAGGSGDIDINDTVGDLAVGVVTATGDDVTLTAAGAITDANAGAANVVAGTLSATAQTGIDLDTTIATLTLADVLGIGAINISDTAGGLAVTTATTFDGDITLNAAGGDLTVTTVTASGTGADVQLSTTTSGDVNVGAVTAAGDTVTITSAGAITDGNGATVNIVADSLSATAQDGIDLDTTIATLTLASVLGTGNINIADTDGLIVTSATTATGGDITLSATGGDLDVTSANAGGTGDIQLTTTTSGNVNVGTVTATGDDVTITSAAAITDGNAGAVNVTADSLTATATSFGTSADAIETSVNSLDINTSTAGGDQFITEANGLTALNLNAGAGDVNLTLTLGGVADSDGATDITADQATVLLNDATAQGFGSGANRIATSVNDLKVTTAAGGGDQFITEANGLTALELNAGVGDVNLTLTLGGVTDTDAATDITAGDLIVTLSDAAAQNFGSGANEILTSVGTLSVDTSAGDGSQFIREVNGLTGLNLNADGGNVNLTLAGGSLLDTDGATDIDALNVSVGAIGAGGSIGAAANPIEIDASGTTVTLDARTGTGSGVHVEVAQAGDITFTDSLPSGTAATETKFTRGTVTFDTLYSSDLTVRANGNIVSALPVGTPLLVPGTLTLNAVGAGSSIGGGIANPFAIDVGTLNATAGSGLSFSDVNNVTLGGISTVSGAFFIQAGNTLTLNGSTVVNAGVGGTAILVANGIPGISVAGTPSLLPRFLIYALNAELTDPLVILNSANKPTIGALVADEIDSPRNFNPATPDPFGDSLNYFIFSLEANPPTDPSLFIDIPVEVFQPVSIVFGDYDPTKFGEVGDLWMSSSELYEIERKAGKARKALPPQVNRAKYTPEAN